MLSVLEFIKSISPEIVTAFFIAFIFWSIRELKKFMKLLNTITAMATDIKEIKGMLPHVFKRLDAQDCSTKELFSALKNQRVNGEAEAAIKLMSEAKNESDCFISGLVFEDRRKSK